MLQRRHLSLTYLELEPAQPEQPSKPEHAPLMIMLHGYGSNEKDLIQLAPSLRPEFRYISARAPQEMDFGMFGWFPIEFTATGIRVDHGEAQQAVEQLIGFIREIIAEYRPAGNKVFLMGFSQGTVMSYLTAFLAPELLHGVIGCSGQLPDKAVPDEALKPALRKLPFLVMHGTYDDILPIAKGWAAKAWLEEHVEDFTWREYPIAHQIADSGIELMCSWLEKRAPEAPEKE
jgi:phospholipase/carboxylesterase